MPWLGGGGWEHTVPAGGPRWPVRLSKVAGIGAATMAAPTGSQDSSSQQLLCWCFGGSAGRAGLRGWRWVARVTVGGAVVTVFRRQKVLQSSLQQHRQEKTEQNRTE